MENEILVIWAGYFTMFVLSIALIAFMQGHFFFTYLKVKASRGKKILCKIRAPTRDYFRAGVPSENVLKVKFYKEKLERHLVFDQNCVYRSWGVGVVDIDEKTSDIIDKSFELKSSYDHPTLSNVMKRIITAPSINDKFIQIILVVSILTLLGVILAYFMLKGDINALHAVIEASKTVEGVNL